MSVNNNNKNYKKNRLILKSFKVIEYNKIINDESSEDKEEYFDMYKIITQLITKIKLR